MPFIFHLEVQSTTYIRWLHALWNENRRNKKWRRKKNWIEYGEKRYVQHLFSIKWIWCVFYYCMRNIINGFGMVYPFILVHGGTLVNVFHCRNSYFYFNFCWYDFYALAYSVFWCLVECMPLFNENTLSIITNYFCMRKCQRWIEILNLKKAN